MTRTNEVKPYWEWECYRSGLYAAHSEWMVQKSVDLLRSEELISWMLEASDKWFVSAFSNLFGFGINHRPWFGQSACFLHHKSTESATRIAWGMLSVNEQAKANAMADIAMQKLVAKTKPVQLHLWSDICVA